MLCKPVVLIYINFIVITRTLGSPQLHAAHSYWPENELVSHFLLIIIQYDVKRSKRRIWSPC